VIYAVVHKKLISESEKWYLQEKGRERQICEELKLWFKQRFPGCPVVVGKKYCKYPDGHREPLSPDIDVMVCAKDNELIGCQVKLLSRQGWKYLTVKDKKKGRIIIKHKSKVVRSKYSDILNRKDVVIEEQKGVSLTAVDPNIYEGMGQALFQLKYVDKSYLVLPRLGSLNLQETSGFLNALLEDLNLPIGLITFVPTDRGHLEFNEVQKAKKSELWRQCGNVYKLYGGYRTLLWQEVSSIGKSINGCSKKY
jgi:hypothetical protein